MEEKDPEAQNAHWRSELNVPWTETNWPLGQFLQAEQDPWLLDDVKDPGPQDAH